MEEGSELIERLCAASLKFPESCLPLETVGEGTSFSPETVPFLFGTALPVVGAPVTLEGIWQ